MTETETTEKGISCTKCGCRDLRVLQTKRHTGGKIMRKRQCRNCGRVLITYEAPAGQIIDPPCLADLTPEQRENFWTRFADFFRRR